MKKIKILSLLAIITPILLTSCKNDKTDDKTINKEAAAEIGFYETYQLKEIAPNIDNLRAEALKANPQDSTIEFFLQNLPTRLENGEGESPVVGYAAPTDTAAVNAILSQFADKCLPADLKLLWTNKPNRDVYELVALKTIEGRPRMDGSTIVKAECEDTPYGPTINLIMNKEGAAQWSQVTAENLNRSVAVVFKNEVYSFPRVLAQIDGGATSITGDFTKQEMDEMINYLYGEKAD